MPSVLHILSCAYFSFCWLWIGVGAVDMMDEPVAGGIVAATALAALSGRWALGGQRRRELLIGNLVGLSIMSFAGFSNEAVLASIGIVLAASVLPVRAQPRALQALFAAMVVMGGIGAHFVVATWFADGLALSLVGFLFVFATPGFLGFLAQRTSSEPADELVGSGLIYLGFGGGLLAFTFGSFMMAVGVILMFAIPATFIYVMALPGIVIARGESKDNFQVKLPFAITLSKNS